MTIGCSEMRTWLILEDVPDDVLVVEDSTGSLIGATTCGRWARMDERRYKKIVPLDVNGKFTEVIRAV